MKCTTDAVLENVLVQVYIVQHESKFMPYLRYMYVSYNMSLNSCPTFNVLFYSSYVQIFGGAGYNSEYPVEKLMRDAKIFQVSYTLLFKF